jgi:hypothetical protein
MSYKTATLTDAEVSAISDPNTLHRDATLELKRLSGLLHPDEDDFEIGLRIWNTLCIYEEKAEREPSLEVLSVLLNGELRLWQITEGVGVEVNPFLTHWVEAVVRMECGYVNLRSYSGWLFMKFSLTLNCDSCSTGNDATNDIFRTRAACIKGLICANGADGMPGVSPHETLHKATMDDPYASVFDIRKYMHILVDTEVWDKSLMSEFPAPPKQVSNGKKAAFEPIAQEEPWQQVMLRKLSKQPEIAVQEITRLPLQIEHLEFLNKLLTDHTFEAHSIERSSVITPYIQHALRLVEEMEAPPPTSDQDLPTNGSIDGMEDGPTIVEYGKEAQSRAVKLLLLFIKNLIVKDLLGTQWFYLEIEEICVRYVWIKEVRDFRTWLEEGV